MIAGRLKHSLKERCPICNRNLQLRVRSIPGLEDGIQVFLSEEYIACPSDECDYEQEVKKKRHRRKEFALEV